MYFARGQNGHWNVDRFSPSCAFCNAFACDSDKCFIKVFDEGVSRIGKHTSECCRNSDNLKINEQFEHDVSNVFIWLSNSR